MDITTPTIENYSVKELLISSWITIAKNKKVWMLSIAIWLIDNALNWFRYQQTFSKWISLVGALVTVFLTAFFIVLLVHTIHRLQTEQPIQFQEYIKSGLLAAWRLIGFVLLVIILLVMILFLGLIVSLFFGLQDFFRSMVYLLAVPGILFSALLSGVYYLFQVGVIVDQLPIFKGISTALRMVRGNLGRVWGVSFIIDGLWVLGYVLLFMISVLIYRIPVDHELFTLQGFANVVDKPLTGLSFAVFYIFFFPWTFSVQIGLYRWTNKKNPDPITAQAAI